ncbi:peptidase S8/S53 domain-containing protein [Xylariaceae sp. FL0255]|nr:peptidase S8/S53 domain-containing protein [Xylariaceae sp. FL0255]
MKAAILLGALPALVQAAVPDTHAVHETRDTGNARWVKRNRVHSRALLPVRIGLVQSNLDKIHDYLMELSDPASKKYGQYYSSDEIVELFKPASETVEAIKQWLSDEGITEVTHSDNKGWIAFDAPSAVVEKLLHTEYYEHEHLQSGARLPATDAYHVPKAIQKHIDFITPGVKLMNKANVQFHGPSLGGVTKRKMTTGGPTLKYFPKHRPHPSGNVSDCDQEITPACVRALYEFPEATRAHPENSMGIYESLLEFWNQQDLDSFFTALDTGIPNGTHPIDDLIDGAVAKTNNVTEDGGETMLDLDLAYPIVYPQTITIFNEDDLNYQGEANVTYMGGFNTFLDAIDGSYCTYAAYGEKGDDSKDGLDPVYPDPLPGGYKGKLQCGVFKPTTVISTSYAGAEADVPIAYQKRQCNEFAKLGMQGVSFLYASGDAGVGQYLPPYGEGCLGPKGDIFSPNWPSTCPYVTAVGATKVYPGYTVYDPESAVLDYAGYPYAVNYSSGGGFSNIYGVPSYQKSVVNTYFAEHNPAHQSYSALAPNAPNPAVLNITTLQGNTGGVYNRIGRGIPDVAANGDNIATYSEGTFGLSGGTSAATPIFASIVNRLNNERLFAGKGPIGFINPTLYAHPEVLNDITNGTNIGCNVTGFPAVKGWDPATGLGTPNYPKMLELFMSLP